MKTLIFSLDKDYALNTGDNLYIIKYDCLNDLHYEIGSILNDLLTEGQISDKANLILNFKEKNLEEFIKLNDYFKVILLDVLCQEYIPEEVELTFSESYVDWLVFNHDALFSSIGKKLKQQDSKLTLNIKDYFEDYILEFINYTVKKAILTDNDIQKFSIDGIENPNSCIVNAIHSLKDNFLYEPYNGSWIECELGLAYNLGNCVTQDLIISLSHYIAAANKGNVIAQNWVGWCYQHGIGTNVDNHLAFSFYQKAAENGSADGIANLGYCYDIGIGTNENKTKACELYERIKSFNYPWAMCNLGNNYRNGLNGEPKLDLALEAYLRGAELGNVECQYQAGLLYLQGLTGTIDKKLALRLLNKASANNHKDAHFYCGQLMDEWVGVGFPDFELVSAETYYKRAVDSGDVRAYARYTAFLENDKDNEDQILDLLKKSADAGFADGQYLLAYKIFDKPKVKSKLKKYSIDTLLKDSSKQGYEPAIQLLSKVIKIREEEEVKRQEKEKAKREQRLKEEKEREELNKRAAANEKRRQEELAKKKNISNLF